MKISINDRAVKEIQRIIQEQSPEIGTGEKTYLRIRILGGGCSGFKTKLDLTTDVNEKQDETYLVESVDVVIDKRSALYLDGVEVDFHEDIHNRGFVVKIPQSTGRCGCGASFSMN